MRYAIISDVHSNIEAFGAALKVIEGLSPDIIINLGDTVGYNADPNDCVDIVREKGIISIMGNHDVCVCGLREPVDFNPVAREAVLWTKKVITSDNNAYLTVLPDNRIMDSNPGGRFLIVHGAVTHRDNYIFNEFDARENFELIKEKHKDINICFFGHTHRGLIHRYKNGRVNAFEEKEMELEPDSMYLINPGSVGQPRDGDPKASFIIYDENRDPGSENIGRKVTYYRVEYEVPKASRKVVAAGLPPQLGQRLLLGI